VNGRSGYIEVHEIFAQTSDTTASVIKAVASQPNSLSQRRADL
jgi:hypothetical protein